MISRSIKYLWHSPTFTTWGKQAAEATRMLAVTPLILTKFDSIEIAAWYLFASLMFFGQLIQGGIGLTFSRMIAFGMAGADSLAPIKERKVCPTKGMPNWDLVGRAYGTISFLNSMLAIFTSMLAAGMGYYGLQRMVELHPRPGEIWGAFLVILVSKAIIFIYQKYEITLRGMNYVPLINRWSTLFSLFSVCTGFTALTLGANIWQLALTMQATLLLNVIRMRFLLNTVENCRAKCFPKSSMDSQVMSWAWPPFWRGLVTNVSQEGVVQFALVLFARHGEPLVVASFLFSYRILRVIGRISNAPFSSHMPKLSKLLAAGEVEQLRKLLSLQIFRSQVLLALGILVGGLVLSVALPLIGSEITFLDLAPWLTLGFIFLVYRFSVMTRGAFSLGNNFPFLKLEVVAGLVAFCLTAYYVPTGNIWALVFCPLLPSVVMITVQAVNKCSHLLHISSCQYLRATSGAVYILYLFFSLLLIGLFR